FSREIIALGMTPGTQLLDADTRPADERLAELLGVSVGSPILRLERIRTADGRPLSLERTYLSLERYPRLDQAPLKRISLRDHLLEVYGSSGVRGERRFTIGALGPADASLLDDPAPTPVFRAEVTIFEHYGSVVETGRALLRADRYEI